MLRSFVDVKEPRYLSLDSEGYVLVADYHCILLLNSQLQLHKLSSQAAGSNTIMLQRTHITTLRSTQQPWAVVVVAIWRHVAICSTLTNRLMSAWVQLAMSLSHQSSFTQLLNFTNFSASPLIYTVVVIATVAISYQCWHVFVFLMLYFIAFPSLLCYFQAGWANSIAGQMLFVSVSVC